MLLNALQYGLPQSRTRCWMIFFHQSVEGIWKVPDLVAQLKHAPWPLGRIIPQLRFQAAAAPHEIGTPREGSSKKTPAWVQGLQQFLQAQGLTLGGFCNLYNRYVLNKGYMIMVIESSWFFSLAHNSVYASWDKSRKEEAVQQKARVLRAVPSFASLCDRELMVLASYTLLVERKGHWDQNGFRG